MSPYYENKYHILLLLFILLYSNSQSCTASRVSFKVFQYRWMLLIIIITTTTLYYVYKKANMIFTVFLLHINWLKISLKISINQSHYPDHLQYNGRARLVICFEKHQPSHMPYTYTYVCLYIYIYIVFKINQSEQTFCSISKSQKTLSLKASKEKIREITWWKNK